MQSFGMGNIVEDSFQQSEGSIRDIPNAFEVQFLNQDKDYVQDSIIVGSEEALDANLPLRIQNLQMCVTKASYAIRLGKRALKIISKIFDKTGYVQNRNRRG